MSEYNPPSDLIEDARGVERELQKIELSDSGESGGNGKGGASESAAGVSNALIAVAGLAGTAYFFMSDQE